MTEETTEVEKGESTEQPTSWRDSLPDDLKTSKTLERYNSVEDAAKALVSLEKTLSNSGRKDAIIPPGKDATDDQKAEYRNKISRALGVPEKPEDYTLTVPSDIPDNIKWSEEKLTEFRQQAHELGLTPDQAQKKLEGILGSNSELYSTLTAKQVADRQSAEEALKKEWGDLYDSRIKKINMVLQGYGDERDADVIEQYGNDPAFIRMMNNITREFREDTIVSEGSPKGGKTTNPRGEAMKLMQSKAFTDAMHPEHESTKAKVRELYDQAAA